MSPSMEDTTTSPPQEERIITRLVLHTLKTQLHHWSVKVSQSYLNNSINGKQELLFVQDVYVELTIS